MLLEFALHLPDPTGVANEICGQWFSLLLMQWFSWLLMQWFSWLLAQWFSWLLAQGALRLLFCAATLLPEVNSSSDLALVDRQVVVPDAQAQDRQGR